MYISTDKEKNRKGDDNNRSCQRRKRNKSSNKYLTLIISYISYFLSVNFFARGTLLKKLLRTNVGKPFDEIRHRSSSAKKSEMKDKTDGKNKTSQ